MKIKILPIILLCLCLACGCGGTDLFSSQEAFMDEELFKVGEISVSVKMAVPLITGQIDLFEAAYGENIWNKQVSDGEFVSYFNSKLKSRIALVYAGSAFAESMNIAPDTEEQRYADEAAREFYNELTPAQKKLLLISQDETADMYRAYRMAINGFNTVIGSEEIEISQDEARIITLMQLRIKKSSGGEEERLQLYEHVQSVYASLCEGADFYATAVRESYSQSIELYAARGDLLAAEEKVAFGLAKGQISELFETPDDYVIFKCISPIERDLTEIKRQILLEERISETYNSKLKVFLAGNPISWNDRAWEELTENIRNIRLGPNFYKVYKKHFSEQ